MRTIAVAVLVFAILAFGVTFHLTPRATALQPAQLDAQVDAYTLQSGAYARSLPVQEIQDLF
jgi:hypothetical protein